MIIAPFAPSTAPAAEALPGRGQHATVGAGSRCRGLTLPACHRLPAVFNPALFGRTHHLINRTARLLSILLTAADHALLTGFHRLAHAGDRRAQRSLEVGEWVG